MVSPVSFIALAPADRCHVKQWTACPVRGAVTVIAYPSVFHFSEFRASGDVWAHVRITVASYIVTASVSKGSVSEGALIRG